MKVLHVCAELYPLLKTGGLADVCAALPAAQRAAGLDARLLLPGFPALRAGTENTGEALLLPTRQAPPFVRALGVHVAVQPARVREGGQPLWLIDLPALYARPGGPYQDASGHDWPDNGQRFALLGWVAARLAQGADAQFVPDVLHAHDWHAGLAAAYLRAEGAAPRCASVFTIHNLAYQGRFGAALWPQLGLPERLFSLDGLEFFGDVSFMKAGLQFSDALTTVSPRYAREILTPEQGFGLDGVLRARAAVLHGILNGVDDRVWDPAHDPLLEAHYDVDHLAGKARNKRLLQKALGLRQRPGALLFGAVSRLSEQKGLHLLPAVLDALVARGGQLVVLGSGDAAIEHALREACARHPGQAVLQTGYDEALAHRIMAASDVVLVPSRFEPCGLTQLYGLRYGALPLVREVGGLADTVVDCSLEALDDGSASGFVFRDFTPEALDAAVRRAFALRRREAEWQRVQAHAMQQRFDWARAARAYADLYDALTRSRPSSARAEP